MNLNIRNFIGGFIGGFAGIALFNFFGFWAMLLGCSGGFILGFYFQEIVQIIRSPYIIINAVVDYSVRDWKQTVADYEFVQSKLQEATKTYETLGGRLVSRITLFFYKLPGRLFRLILWATAVPRHVYRWSKHPVSQSWIASVGITSLTYSVMLFNLILIGIHCNLFHDDGVLGACWIIGQMTTISGLVIGIMYHKNVGLKSNFWSRYESWSHNPKGFMLDTLRVTIRTTTFGFLSGFLLMCMFVIGLIPTIILLLSLLVIQGMLRVLYRVSQIKSRTAHMTGAIVTMIVTCITALITRNTMNDITVWLISFGNGTVCGLGSVGVHQLAKAMFRNEQLGILAFGTDFDAHDILWEKGIGLYFKFIWNRICAPFVRYWIGPVGYIYD